MFSIVLTTSKIAQDRFSSATIVKWEFDTWLCCSYYKVHVDET